MAGEGSLRRNAGVLAGGFLAFFSLNILNTSYSIVMALIKADLALTYTMSGALTSVYFVGYAIGQVPWGALADRIGSRRVMVASILGIATSTILFGFAQGFWQAALARLVSGLLGAGVFVPGVRLVSGWFPPEERGTALGIFSIGASAGLISSSTLSPYIATIIGWRATIMGIGLLGLTLTTVMWVTLKDNDADERAGGDGDLRDVLTDRSFWALGAIQMARLGANYVFIAWLPLLLQEEFGMSLVAAGAAFSLFNIAGMVSNPLGGIISDRLGERIVLLVSFAVLAVGSFAFTLVKGGLPLYLVILVIGWFINFVRSPSFALIPRLYGVERAGKVSGIQNTFASIGALVLPFLIGYIRDATDSYWAGWIALALVLGAVAVSALFLRTAPEND
ncbi:MFS transporter [Candidatus Bathyarchaeota archaeon]|nr:MFS transporter [Candidatus Bathyarchaeota archaeon]